MHEKNMRYGQFLRAKRLSDSRELTLKDIAAELDVSVSFVSDVEQGRRKPYDEAKTQKLIEFLRLTEEDTALMYDLAAKENSRIPAVRFSLGIREFFYCVKLTARKNTKISRFCPRRSFRSENQKDFHKRNWL